MKKVSVLVISGGSYQGLTVIKGLRCCDSLRVIMADSSRENIGKYFADQFYHVPEINEGAVFINTLLRICKKENIGLVIPSTDRELPVLAEHINLFNKNNIFVAVSSVHFLNIMMNKRALYAFIEEKGYSVLPSIELIETNVNFPILGKPLHGWGSRDIIVLNSQEELKNHSLSVLKTEYLWQQYIKEFEEYSIDCAIRFDGKISEFVIRRRIKTVGGYAVIAENVDEPALSGIIKSFLSMLCAEGAVGIFNIQVLKKDAQYFLSDINPRIGTSAVFSYKLGINLPLFLCSNLDASIYRPPHINEPKSLKMVRYLEEMWIEKKAAENIKGIVFDLDDTLINHKLWILNKLEILWSLFIDELPMKETFLLQCIQIIEEGNRDRLFDALEKEFRISGSLKKKMISTYRTIKTEGCPLFEDVLPVLGELRKLGFKLALLTDNPPASQKQKVKTCKLLKEFDAIVYAREVSIEKPDKNAFKEVARLLQLPEKSLAMVGDNLYRDIFGSLEAEYGTAFWIVRNGGFYNFDQKIFNKLVGELSYTRINNLRHLLWHFQ